MSQLSEEQKLIALAEQHATKETSEYRFACTVLNVADSAGMFPNGLTRELRQQQTKQFIGGVIERLYGLTSKETSLLDSDSQAGTYSLNEGGKVRSISATTPEAAIVMGHIIARNRNAAFRLGTTAMRDKCVNKVREYLPDCRDEEIGIIEAIAAELSVLTLDQVKPGEM